jgi:hypothetical protein
MLENITWNILVANPVNSVQTFVRWVKTHHYLGIAPTGHFQYSRWGGFLHIIENSEDVGFGNQCSTLEHQVNKLLFGVRVLGMCLSRQIIFAFRQRVFM